MCPSPYSKFGNFIAVFFRYVTKREEDFSPYEHQMMNRIGSQCSIHKIISLRLWDLWVKD